MWRESGLTLDISAGSPRMRVTCFPRRISFFKQGRKTLGFEITEKLCRTALCGVVENHLLEGRKRVRGIHMEEHRALRSGI